MSRAALRNIVLLALRKEARSQITNTIQQISSIAPPLGYYAERGVLSDLEYLANHITTSGARAFDIFNLPERTDNPARRPDLNQKWRQEAIGCVHSKAIDALNSTIDRAVTMAASDQSIADDIDAALLQLNDWDNADYVEAVRCLAEIIPSPPSSPVSTQ
jgi:hypothetical protein